MVNFLNSGKPISMNKSIGLLRKFTESSIKKAASLIENKKNAKKKWDFVRDHISSPLEKLLLCCLIPGNHVVKRNEINRKAQKQTVDEEMKSENKKDEEEHTHFGNSFHFM